MSDNRPTIGLGVFIYKNGKFLMGLRKGAHGAGSWSVPGGHLEFGESLEKCAKREVFEETGLRIKNIRLLAVTNNIFNKEGKHSVTLWMESNWAGGKLTIKEPDKLVGLAWHTFKDLPKPLFMPWKALKKTKPELFKT